MKSLSLKSSLLALGTSAMAVSLLISSWVQDSILARIYGAELYKKFLDQYFAIETQLPKFEGKLAELEQTYNLISTVSFVVFAIFFFVAGFVTYKIARNFGKGRNKQNSLIWLGAAIYSISMLPIDVVSYVLNPFSSSYGIFLYAGSVVSVAIFQVLMVALIAFGFMGHYRKNKSDAFEEKLETKHKPSTQKTRIRLLAISILVPVIINIFLMIAAYPTASHRAIANQITETNAAFFNNISDENIESYDKKIKQLTTTPEGKYSDRVNIFGSIIMFPVSVGVIAWIYWQLRKKADPQPMKTFLTIGAITALVSLWISELVHRLYGIDTMIPLWLLGILSIVGPLFTLLPTWLIGLITKYFYEKRNGFEAS